MNRSLLIGLTVTGVVIIGLLVAFPDMLLRLRTQVAPTLPETTEVTQTLAWTPGEDEAVGTRRVTIEATDDRGGRTTKEITVDVESNLKELTGVTIDPADTSAAVTWTTSFPARRSATFDVGPRLRHERAEVATDTPATSHSLTIDDLVPCTTYSLRLRARGAQAAEDVESSLYSFTTTGCAGGASVSGVARSDIATGGGEVRMAGRMAVNVPASVAADDVHVQIHQLDRDAALATIGTPGEGLMPVTGLYEVGVYSDGLTELSDLSEAVTVTTWYTPAENTDLTSLAIFRHDGTAWSEIEDCTRNETDHTMACEVAAFSAVAGFATGGGSTDPEPEPEAEQEAENSNGGDGGGDSGGGGDGGGGGDDGGGDSGGGESAPERTVRTLTFQPETGHTIEGPYSGVVSDGSRRVAKLAANASLLSRSVTAPRDDYYLDAVVKHDRPGPIVMAVYVNNTAWKVVSLNQGDNQYRTHRIGLLRNFQNATIRFRLVNDTYDRNNPGNEEADRNLFVDAWRLTTDTQATAISSSGGTGGGAPRATGGSGRSAGWSLLPSLNSIMRQELGSQHVTFENWRYYASRLTLPASNPAVIQTEDHLRTVMRYWIGASPANPRGEPVR